jgi:FkbM family methyltransferase
VDIGANIGELNLHNNFRKAQYVGIEPDPDAFRALSLNNPESILVNCALSDIEGEQEFYLCTSEADSSLFKPANYTETITIRVQTLDSCLDKIGNIKRIKLLKIEAEGMEPEILAGSTITLEKTKYIALDAGPERGGKSTAPECLNKLLKEGFEIKDTFLLRGTFLLENTKLSELES